MPALPAMHNQQERAQGQLRQIPSSSPELWDEAMRPIPHDFYHTAAYHRFAEQRGEGQASLLVYSEGRHRFLWPCLLRPIPALEPRGFYDVTSVYGYPGPLVCGGEDDPSFLERACHAIMSAWRSQRVVAAFTRLHPVLGNHRLFPSGAPPARAGTTVAIDLTQPPERIWSGYQSSLRHRINQARAKGVVVELDRERRHLPKFAELYRRTMRRNQASPYYSFGQEDFHALLDQLGSRAVLMAVRWQDQVIGAGIFVEHGGMELGGIVQNHFCMNDPEFLHLSPSKVLLDEVRRWAAGRGNRLFHLGGGRGGQRDSLFDFKAAFSKQTCDFYTWKGIIEPQVYEDLCNSHDLRFGPRETSPREADGAAELSDFFPAYRENLPSGLASPGLARPSYIAPVPAQAAARSRKIAGERPLPRNHAEAHFPAQGES